MPEVPEPAVGQKAFRAPERPGDTITAEVEVLEARTDKPITRLATVVTDQVGDVVLDGTALVYRVQPAG